MTIATDVVVATAAMHVRAAPCACSSARAACHRARDSARAHACMDHHVNSINVNIMDDWMYFFKKYIVFHNSLNLPNPTLRLLHCTEIWYI